MIANPAPITPQTFAGMWITTLGVFFPTTEKPRGFIGGNLLPYDGQHLLATSGKRVFVGDLAARRASDAQLDAMLTALAAECQRQAGKTAAVKFITVAAPDPTKSVVAQISFVDGSFHRIPDCFALAATDTAFAAVLGATMAEVARLAGLNMV